MYCAQAVTKAAVNRRTSKWKFKMDIAAYLTIAPNWASPVTVSHIWMTGMLRSEPGLEQRSGLLTWPRRKIKYQLDIFDEEEARRIKRHFYKYLHKIFGVPIWPDDTYLTAEAATGQKILMVESTLYRRFVAGGRVILLDPADYTNFEAGVIDVVAETQITLVDELDNTWPENTLVYPLLAARLAASQEIRIPVPKLGEISIEAIEAFE